MAHRITKSSLIQRNVILSNLLHKEQTEHEALKVRFENIGGSTMEGLKQENVALRLEMSTVAQEMRESEREARNFSIRLHTNLNIAREETKKHKRTINRLRRELRAVRAFGRK